MPSPSGPSPGEGHSGTAFRHEEGVPPFPFSPSVRMTASKAFSFRRILASLRKPIMVDLFFSWRGTGGSSTFSLPLQAVSTSPSREQPDQRLAVPQFPPPLFFPAPQRLSPAGTEAPYFADAPSLLFFPGKVGRYWAPGTNQGTGHVGSTS